MNFRAIKRKILRMCPSFIVEFYHHLQRMSRVQRVARRNQKWINQLFMGGEGGGGGKY